MANFHAPSSIIRGLSRSALNLVREALRRPLRPERGAGCSVTPANKLRTAVRAGESIGIRIMAKGPSGQGERLKKDSPVNGMSATVFRLTDCP
jgi:ABC-type phosphonate transport system ATPase subunit